MNSLGFLSLLLIAVGLSADCFAVALCSSCSMKTLSRFQILRASLSFGTFQAVMPLLGWLAGRTLVDFIGNFASWLAFGLLGFVGGKMLWESLHPDKEQKTTDFTKGFMLLTLSLATSIDALAVGISFAFLKVNILTAGLIIGITCFVISIIGFMTGRKAGEIIGKRAERVGGLILIGIGVRILLVHLLA